MPNPLLVKLTEPVGGIAGPGDVSVTVAVQDVGWFTATGDGLQETVVMVGCFVTVRAVMPELLKWSMSPVYVAVIVWIPSEPGSGV